MDRFRLMPNYRYYNLEGTSPLTLPNSAGRPLRGYKIYGNSVQDGTPAPDAPIEIQSVGDLVTDVASEYYGKYAVPIVVNDTTTHIYLDEPLRKIGDYGDYIDFKTGKTNRSITHRVFDGTENWRISSGFIYLSIVGIKDSRLGYSTHFEFGDSATVTGNVWFRPVVDILRVYQRTDDVVFATVEDWKTFLQEQYAQGTPVEVLCIINTFLEEDITLPAIKSHKGSNIFTVGTDVAPSDIKVQYYK